MNQPQDFRTMTSETIGKDLLSALVTEIKLLPDAWPKISKAKQDDIIDRLRERVDSNVKMAVHLLAAEGRTVVAGDIDQITIKDGVKAVVKFGSRAPNLLELFEAAGKAVLLIVAHSESHTGGMDEIRGEADQRGLDLGHEYKPNSDGDGMGNHSENTIIGEASRLPSPLDVTVTEEQLDEAFDDGYNAANDGKPESDCPIMAGKLCIEWVKGWKNWHEENGVTAKLGASPNEHGVYICEPDEVLEWKNKQDFVEIKLIELICGKWTYSISRRIADEGSGSLPSIHSIADSRDDALRIAQENLLKICAKGKDSGLNAKDLKDFTAFVNGLVESDERNAA